MLDKRTGMVAYAVVKTRGRFGAGQHYYRLAVKLGRTVTKCETADMLVQEVLSRNMRDRRAVARYAGLTGAPARRAAESVETMGWPALATLEFDEA